jgi:predicted nucleic acid-binding protein
VILYLGTSSLVKLYVEEACSDVVREWIREAEIVATCRVAYTETVWALESRLKNNDLSRKDYERTLRRFTEDWSNYAIVDFDDIEAGNLVKKYDIRRFDAMHLSAAKLLQRHDKSVSVGFSSFDPRLCNAAAAEGLKVLRPPRAG